MSEVDWDLVRKELKRSRKRAVYERFGSNKNFDQVLPWYLYHGSPTKLKKGDLIEARGPIFYGEKAKGVSMSDAFKDAAQYAKGSDSGGINKIKYGETLNPKVFAQKGYVYKIDTRRTRGVFPTHWEANDDGSISGFRSRVGHWSSYRDQPWESRKSIRFKGKLPITKNEALVGGGIAAGATLGYYGYKHRDEIRAKSAALGDHIHSAFHSTRSRLGA